MANSYLNRTPSSTGNRRKFTFSFWIKKSSSGASETIYNVRPDSNGANRLSFHSTDTFRIAFEPISKYIFTTRRFRDSSGFYHIVVAVDTEQATAADRVKLYVNGVQEGSLIKGDGGAATYPDQNADLDINTQNVINIGRDLETSSNFLNGYISHFSFVDGQQLTPTTFGETDSTSGMWKFKSPTGVTWGTNGFHLKFENSGAMGTDSSGNSNTFTVNGNLKQALDTPSNVYATWGKTFWIAATLTNGNTTIQTQSNNYAFNPATLGFTQGKWYWENKIDSTAQTDMFGISGRTEADGTTNELGHFADQYGFSSYSGVMRNNNTETSYASAFNTNGKIVQIAVDVDNLKIYLGLDGVWQNSANPANNTGGLSIGALSTTQSGFYFPAIGDYSNGAGTYSTNFGNGFFGTTAITSAGSNGNGSLFEYDVPSGFYAVNTKNINTYG